MAQFINGSMPLTKPWDGNLKGVSLMANIVFILGAGASKQAGAPLMVDFLDVANDLWKGGQVGRDAYSDFERIFNAISALQPVHSKSQLDLQNIESVFAAFEMAQTLHTLSNYKPSEINALSNSMKSLIVTTIQLTMKLPVNNLLPYPPDPYDSFFKLLMHLKEDVQPKQTVAVITFNYDLGLDYTSYFNEQPLWYGLDDNQPPQTIPVLKLHGSMNWAFCSKCAKAIPWYLKDYYSKRRWDIFPDTKNVTIGISSHLIEYEGHSHNLDSYPLVVPPTWNKSGYYRVLAPVWSSAAKHLREAENIFVIGYSLPMSDAFFRYLYALSTVGPQPFKRFWVFNPENSGETEKRFREILGPGASQRFRYFPQTFDKAIDELSKTF